MKELKIEVTGGCIFPNELKDWYFPNWFNKEHFETFMDRKLTQKQFSDLKDMLDDTSIMDEISELISCVLNDEDNTKYILED